MVPVDYIPVDEAATGTPDVGQQQANSRQQLTFIAPAVMLAVAITVIIRHSNNNNNYYYFFSTIN
jgi:hypothetical protein